MTTMTYSPVWLCSCGTAVHGGDSLDAHVAYWHSPHIPAFPRMATREEHAAAGWDVSDWPRSIRG